jgi:hypothetical protein
VSAKLQKKINILHPFRQKSTEVPQQNIVAANVKRVPGKSAPECAPQCLGSYMPTLRVSAAAEDGDVYAFCGKSKGPA